MNKKYNISDNMFAVLSKIKKKCKHCGHSMIFEKVDKMICTHCGNYVYKNDKIEFMDNLNKKLKGVK